MRSGRSLDLEHVGRRRAPSRARWCSRARVRCPATRTRGGACAPRWRCPRICVPRRALLRATKWSMSRFTSSRRRASGGIVNRQDVDAVEEVLAEAPGLHLGGEIAVRRGDDADVDLHVLAGRRGAGSISSCEHAEELHLEVQRQLADLVEEERAAVGLLEEAAAVGRRVGERALLVAEELALEEVLGDGAAVDGDERRALARATACGCARATSSLPMPLSPVMSTVVLKSAILEIVRKMSTICGLFARIDSNWFVLLDLLLERAVLAAERLALLGLSQREDDLVRLEGLAHVVVGARLHRLEREVDVAVRAHHDDGRRVLLRLERRRADRARPCCGMRTSVRMTSGPNESTSASAASPPSATSTS